MSDSRLVGSFGPERDLDDRQLAEMRPAVEPAPRRRMPPRYRAHGAVSVEMKCFYCAERFDSHKATRIHERRCRESPVALTIPSIPLDAVLHAFGADEDGLYTCVIADRLAEMSEEWAELSAYQVGRAIARHGARSRNLGYDGNHSRGYVKADLLAARQGAVNLRIPVGVVYPYETTAGERWAYKLTGTAAKRGFITRAEAEQSLERLKKANERERRKALKEYALQLALEEGRAHTPIFRCRCTPHDNECSRWPERGHGTWFVRISAVGPDGKRIQPDVMVDEYLARGGKLNKPRLRLRVREAGA